jgi:4-hydroxybenzoate polyprenyltransferase
MRHAVLGIARASRVHKLIPLLLLLASAALLSDGPLDLGCLALSISFVFTVSVLGMQLNVLTDRELDRDSKPKLAQQLTASPELLRNVLAIEVLASAALLVAIVPRSALVGAALLGYGVGFTCYSYNLFAPRRAAQTRWKAFWWGNAIAVGGGYLALWLAGLGCGGGPLTHAPRVWLVAIAFSVLDYGLFLVEAAEDAGEERSHRLQTLPALLGRTQTCAIGAALALGGALGVLFGVQGSHGARLVALLASALLELSAASIAWLSRSERRVRFGEHAADFAFWAARISMFGLLLAGRLAS